MYQVIRKHPTTREMYAEQLEKAGVTPPAPARRWSMPTARSWTPVK
jgi:2-oxoglutarate dehydrogenase complex dehydrogenase (E1) component-like enzyme